MQDSTRKKFIEDQLKKNVYIPKLGEKNLTKPLTNDS